jgi:hypothetical protein
METLTTFKSPSYIYGTEYDYENTINIKDLNNKLFCTFTTLDSLDDLINRSYPQIHHNVQQNVRVGD